MHRLRFAPSPTGYLHVGGARTALINWLFVKRYGGQFLLRIEDTDKSRSTDASTRAIFEGMTWLGLQWDEDVTFQGANVERHRHDVGKLLEGGHAYRCFCTAEEIATQRAAAEARKEAFRYDGRCSALPQDEVDRRVAAGIPHAVRFRMPPGSTSWDDLVHGTITFANTEIGEGDFIILRSDATPIYNLAVVSDDIDSRITVVMRGDDHISNTPKQILLYRALGASLPIFAHLPNVNGPDGKKLSKRHGATAVGDYQHMGILPQAMMNFLALLGWAPGNDIELMTADDMARLFSTDGLQKKSAVFDFAKLEWMNGQYLSQMPAEELLSLVNAVAPTTSTTAALSPAVLLQLLDLLKVRARTVTEIARQVEAYSRDDVVYDPDAVAKQWKDSAATRALLQATHDALSALTAWDAQAMENSLRQLAESRGLSAGKLFQPLRVALTGSAASPGIFEVLLVLGRERSLHRISAAIRTL